MTNYVQSTNFATKDALPSGDPLKIVKGTEINTEFVNIATAVATKLDITSLYPIGSIYINASDSTSPASLFGFGTWAAFGAGRVLVGFNSSNALFDAAEETGGSYDATLPSHTHTGTTGGQSANHTHGFSGTTSGQSADHSHNITASSGGAGDFRVRDDTGSIRGTYDTSGTSNDHSHTYSGNTGAVSSDHSHSFTTASSGSSATNANIQPYITVYMWKRTA
jgi:hypothetical protein